MTPELIAIIVATIILVVLILTRSRALRADFREHVTRVERQIDRLRPPVILLPCDIVLTRGHGFLSRAIRLFTRGLGEPRTKVNHVGIVVRGGAPPAEAIIIEALSRVRRHSLGKRYGDGQSDVAIYRATNLTAKEKICIVVAAKRYEGRQYGYFKILLHFLDWMLQGAYVFRRLSADDDYPICSWLVAHSYAKGGKNFGVKPAAASPDDIWDFVTKRPPNYSPPKYTCIRELRPL